jgi:KDO2-lipid IV(A) lauroyltransferase
MGRYLLYKFMQFLVNILPLRVSFALARVFSDTQYFFSRRDRKSVRNNLAGIMPGEDNVQWCAREVFRNFARYLIEFFWMERHFDRAAIVKNCDCDGLDYLKEALDRRKGVLLVTAHIGNWEMGAATLSLLGHPILAVALTHADPMVNNLFDQQRRTKGIEVVPAAAAIRPCLEALRANRIVAIVADRDFTSYGLKMSFLGRQVSLPRGAAILALKTGAPIVPAFFLRKGPNKFQMTVKKPIYTDKIFVRGALDNNVVRGVMEKYVPEIERVIKENPDQWLMFREY